MNAESSFGELDSTVTVPSFQLPFSATLSAEARAAFIARLRRPLSALSSLDGPFPSTAEYHAAVDKFRGEMASLHHALVNHDPNAIGIFGYSAGAVLTAQVVAWLAHTGLPGPGAVAMCSAGAGAQGDSRFVAAVAMGDAPPTIDQPPDGWRDGYLGDADHRDPLVAPIHWPEVLARFPPSLLLSGTRSFDLSDVVLTRRALNKAGVVTELHVWERLWHCFPYNRSLPEAGEAFDVLAAFFNRHLASKVPPQPGAGVTPR